MVLDWTNRVLSHLGLALIPRWRLLQPSFLLNGETIEVFCHSFNCGYPPARMSERCVELAIADRWLARHFGREVWEVGAVTPYYWPGRLKVVIDPYDDHPLVSRRTSLFTEDFSGRSVLSISTLEHVGTDDYGPRCDETFGDALEKLSRECRELLVTVPYGLNTEVDRLVFTGTAPHRLRRTFLVRGLSDNLWREVTEPLAHWPEYGILRFRQQRWANAIALLEKH